MNSLPLPIRVLHVLGCMNIGGLETWLLHILREINPQKVQMVFLVHTENHCAYDDEIRACGSRIIPCLTPSRPWMYARNFRRILKKYGPYDVVHSHVHHFSGFVLKLAHSAGVPVRIAHCHNDTTPVDCKATMLRRMYLRLCEHWIRKHATLGFAVSQKAAEALWGRDWSTDERWRILRCAIDLEPFRRPVDGAAVRAELGIPQDALVVGHVGRFDPQKNHEFLLEIFKCLAKSRPNIRLLLVGDGPLRSDIEQKASGLGITDKIIFAGLRRDVSRLMLGAMNVFVMPSLYEGLPIVGIEAQAAGLPYVLSDAITEEIEIEKTLVHWVRNNASPAFWADAIMDAVDHAVVIPPATAVAGTHFDIQASAAELCRIYTTHSFSLLQHKIDLNKTRRAA